MRFASRRMCFYFTYRGHVSTGVCTKADTDSLRFLWRKATGTVIEGYAIRVHVIAKTDSLYGANWAFKWTTPEDDY